MDNIDLVAEIMALKIFTDETSKKIDELDFYTKSGILGNEIHDRMKREIVARIAVTDVKLRAVLVAMDNILD